MAYEGANLKTKYDERGFVVVLGLLPRHTILSLRQYANSLIQFQDQELPATRYIQTAYNDQHAIKMVKASGLAERDERFHELARTPALVDIVEHLVGVGARRFRDVMVVKPARTGGALSYHQDSAYWDVEPKSLVSCWISLGDVSADGSCLSVIPGTHTDSIEHHLYIAGRHRVPPIVSRSLRRMASLAGTGDNPDGTGGSQLAWKVKRMILSGATRYAPILFDLQDFRLSPSDLQGREEQLLPVSAGDVVFFHSLLWHASGPNRSDQDRYAEIISFMGPEARFVGKGSGHFAHARS